MRRLFRNMDLLKLVILLLIVASAGLGGWNFLLRQQLDDARRAWRRAKTDVAAIHGLIKEVTTLYRAMDEQGVGQDPSVYFENQLTEFGKIHKRAYTLKVGDKPVPIGRKRATERTMEVQFKGRGNDRTFLPRENWFRAIYNCERNSKSWRLRDLHVRSRDDMDPRRKKDSGYPDELADEWHVQKLVFAMREPLSK